MRLYWHQMLSLRRRHLANTWHAKDCSASCHASTTTCVYSQQSVSVCTNMWAPWGTLWLCHCPEALVLCSLNVGTGVRQHQQTTQYCCGTPPPWQCDWEWLLTTGQTTSLGNKKSMDQAVRVGPPVTKILTAVLSLSILHCWVSSSYLLLLPHWGPTVRIIESATGTVNGRGSPTALQATKSAALWFSGGITSQK